MWCYRVPYYYRIHTDQKSCYITWCLVVVVLVLVFSVLLFSELPQPIRGTPCTWCYHRPYQTLSIMACQEWMSHIIKYFYTLHQCTTGATERSCMHQVNTSIIISNKMNSFAWLYIFPLNIHPSRDEIWRMSQFPKMTSGSGFPFDPEPPRYYNSWGLGPLQTLYNTRNTKVQVWTQNGLFVSPFGYLLYLFKKPREIFLKILKSWNILRNLTPAIIFV